MYVVRAVLCIGHALASAFTVGVVVYTLMPIEPAGHWIAAVAYGVACVVLVLQALVAAWVLRTLFRNPRVVFLGISIVALGVVAAANSIIEARAWGDDWLIALAGAAIVLLLAVAMGGLIGTGGAPGAMISTRHATRTPSPGTRCATTLTATRGWISAPGILFHDNLYMASMSRHEGGWLFRDPDGVLVISPQGGYGRPATYGARQLLQRLDPEIGEGC